MPLGSFHQYLLLALSGFVLLMQTVVKSHTHQPGSYHDARSSFHAPPSSLTLENSDFSVDITPANAILTCFRCFVPFAQLLPLCMNGSPRHDPSPSRAPPQSAHDNRRLT
jgi:hypothetical protein